MRSAAQSCIGFRSFFLLTPTAWPCLRLELCSVQFSIFQKSLQPEFSSSHPFRRSDSVAYWLVRVHLPPRHTAAPNHYPARRHHQRTVHISKAMAMVEEQLSLRQIAVELFACLCLRFRRILLANSDSLSFSCRTRQAFVVYITQSNWVDIYTLSREKAIILSLLP